MENESSQETIILREILSTIRPSLSDTEYFDIADFIEAGESGLATDTIFCAISEDQIDVDDPTLAKLSSLRGLFNTFDDADPGIVERVLNRSQGGR